MGYTGTIIFPNTLTDAAWRDLVEAIKLQPANATKMTNPATGDSVAVMDPPNLIGLVVDGKKNQIGVVRSSRLFFNGGVGPEAEISFEGEGEEFISVIKRIAELLEGEVVTIQ